MKFYNFVRKTQRKKDKVRFINDYLGRVVINDEEVPEEMN